MSIERADAIDAINVTITRSGGMSEAAEASGVYHVECFDADGKLKWCDSIKNLVVTVGKNLALDAFLAGANYTVVGPFMGLISSVGFSAIAATDTMASHPGWTEAGGVNAPTYTAPRKTAAWNAAAGGNKGFSAPLQFSITGNGTIKGAFLCMGAGAVNTIDNANGTLWSAGLFTAGDRSVAGGDTINISYMASL